MSLLHQHRVSGADFISRTLASGGDRRIVVRHGSNTNVYGASPFPRSTLGYAASTANDISQAAFSHLQELVAGWPAGHLLRPAAYRDLLEAARGRIRRAFGLGPEIGIVFAPSGTDLEFVALALAAARSGRPVANILLGQDEVGSGCILSAAGRYFADETALCPATPRGGPIAELAAGRIIALPLRDAACQPVPDAAIAAQIDAAAVQAQADGLHPLAHVVHGSKTGLVLPGLAEIDRLRARHGDGLSWVVDACQLRLEAADIRAYLERDAVVMLTGSKFAGGPPFLGFALVPPRLHPSRPLAAGLGTIFRRAEWPLAWAACDHLPQGANPGLLLRLEAALFEIERFAAVPGQQRSRVIGGFCTAVHGLAQRLGARLVAPLEAAAGLHRSTVATLDLSALPGAPDLATTQLWQRVLAARGLRLGQPVRCLRRADGGWAGNLRVSLSMPLIVERAQLEEAALHARFARDMARIAEVLEAAQRPVAL